MDDKERARIVSRAHNTKNLNPNDIHELKSIMRVGLQPFYNDIRRILEKAERDDDAAILKAALQGESSLSNNERSRLDDAVNRRGRRRL